MNTSRIIVTTLLACTSLGAAASTGTPLSAEKAVSPSRQYAVAIPRAPETSYAYLTEDAPTAQPAIASTGTEKVVASAGKRGGETNALAVCAVGLLIAGFTILRRLN